MPYEKIEDKIQRRLEQLHEYLLEKFPKLAFPAIHHWIENVIKYSFENLAGRHFFTRLYKMDVQKFRHEISNILNVVGVPLLVNNKHELGTSLGDDKTKNQFIQLLLAYEFSTYVKRDNPICPMYDVCENGNPNLINEDCMNAPFRRANEEDLCPFGTFIKSHNLANITWSVNGDVLSGLETGPWS